MDNSVYQARWLLMPVAGLTLVLLTIGLAA